MKRKSKVNSVVQVILGLFLVTTGLNKFVHFMSMPEMPEAANQFMRALSQTGYMMPMIGIVEIVVGVLLVAHLWSALALAILAPLSVNILMFHLALAPGSIAMALVVVAANAYLIFAYRKKYLPMLGRAPNNQEFGRAPSPRRKHAREF